jgi:hypothetical protein
VSDALDFHRIDIENRPVTGGQNVRPGVRWRTVLGPLAALLLTGCPRLWLPRDLVGLPEAHDCPNWPIVENLVDAGRAFDRNTDRHVLECALNQLRQPQAMTWQPALLASRLCFLLADQETDRRRAERFGSEGTRWAEFAVAHQGEKEGAVHYYLAANLGIAVRHQIVLAVKNLGRIERELKLAVDLAPGEDQGGPLRVLSVLYLKAPAWPQGIGDPDRALELAQRAATEYPDHPANHLFLAQALWEVQGDTSKDEVRQELETTERLIASGRWGYSSDAWRKDIRQLAIEAKLGPVPVPANGQGPAPAPEPGPAPSPGPAPAS